MHLSTPVLAPPRTETSEGALRRVGVEIEYAGPSLKRVAEQIGHLYGGELVCHSTFRYEVKGGSLGTFRVESDSSFLREDRYLELMGSLGVSPGALFDFLGGLGVDLPVDRLRRKIDQTVEGLAAPIVPYEVITSPIPYPQLAELERLVQALRLQGAVGTRSSLISVFGAHLNPELQSLDAITLRDHLRAMILLHEWLVWIGGVDFKRRLSPFIDRFPESYATLVLAPGYEPDLDQLTDDYLEHNPTRNRGLDLLPILALHDLEKVQRISEESGLVRPRPAYHYRLPNSMIDDRSWSLAAEWNRWVLVEKLAANAEIRDAMAEDFLVQQEETRVSFRDYWLRRSARWVERLVVDRLE